MVLDMFVHKTFEGASPVVVGSGQPGAKWLNNDKLALVVREVKFS